MRIRKLYISLCAITLILIYCNIWIFRYRFSQHHPKSNHVSKPPQPKNQVKAPAKPDKSGKVAEAKVVKTLTTKKPEVLIASNSSIFIYRVYYDDRVLKGRMRIFAISKCLQTGTNLRIKMNDAISPLQFRPVEGGCPWEWASKCKWNAYEFWSGKTRFVPDVVEILLDNNRSVEVKVEMRKDFAAGELQVCVPPLYYYHDWARLILFFELWRKHSPTFIIYAHSMSKSAARVIEYYKVQDVVKLVHWPALPPSKDGEDPNASVYRLSHSLAHNDCLLRMSAQYGALVDVDEYIHLSNNLTLLEYVQPRFKKDKKLGSLMFPHFGLKLGNLNNNFDGVVDAKQFTDDRPTKSVFKTDNARFLSTHWVYEHEPKDMKKEKVSRTDGILLHYRMNFDNGKTKDPIPLGGINLEYVQWRVREAAKEIFGDEMPKPKPEITAIMERCNAKWKKEGCKVPSVKCKEDLQHMEYWEFFEPSDDSHYSIL